MGVQFQDNSAQVMAQFERNKAKTLEEIGLTWQRHASEEAKMMGVMKTGRFRASLSYITPTRASGPNASAPGQKPSDALSGTSETDAVTVGSNVEYAAYLENGTWKMAARPTVNRSVLNYQSDYRQIIERTMGQGFGK